MGELINPIYKKEMIMELRGLKFPIVILIYNGILALIGMLIFTTDAGSDLLDKMTAYIDTTSVYSVLLMIEYVIVLFIVPVYAASRVSCEYEKGTIQLLMLTKMNHFQIIWAKLCAVVTLIIILVLSSIPVFAIILYQVGISAIIFIKYIFIVITTTMFVGCLGVLVSTILKKTIPAILVTYLILIVLTVGTFYLMKMVPIVMLVNPIFTMLKLITESAPSSEHINNFINEGIGTKGFLAENWMFVSVMVQAIISVGVVYLTATMCRIGQYGKKIKNLPEE